MLIVQVKDGESIEKALKKFKKKFEKTGVVKALRERQKFTKPSVVRRAQIIKARYVENMKREEAGA
jgi:small subunit ribosomal protein S21